MMTYGARKGKEEKEKEIERVSGRSRERKEEDRAIKNK